MQQGRDGTGHGSVAVTAKEGPSSIAAAAKEENNANNANNIFSSKVMRAIRPIIQFVPTPGKPAPAPPQSKRGEPQKPNEIAKIQPNRT
jgi:hypothetical protein